MEKSELTKEMRWVIADMLAKNRLGVVNLLCEEVTVKRTIYNRYIKRMIDIIVAALALMITFPVNLVIGIVTFFDVGKPIFFKQDRVGKDGRIFKIIKFRNMKETRDEKGELLPPAQRITQFGRLVRRASLDELLNFWNVLKGDMSLIGPRPLVPEYLTRYSNRHQMRMAVRPGLECPPRKPIDHVWSWQEQFENDIWYVENVSFLTDCKMIICLIQFAINRKNSIARGAVARGIFMGYDFDGLAITLEEVPQEYIDNCSIFTSLPEEEVTEILKDKDTA